MWHWLEKIFGSKSRGKKAQDEIHLADDGIYCLNWMSRSQQWPVLWPWYVVREFGLSYHKAIYPDPWFGNYMEAEWFFTVEHTDGPQRIFFDIDDFSIDALPEILPAKLPGFDIEALREGWKQYRLGERNFKGEGQWLAWKSEGFTWPAYSETLDSAN